MARWSRQETMTVHGVLMQKWPVVSSVAGQAEGLFVFLEEIISYVLFDINQEQCIKSN